MAKTTTNGRANGKATYDESKIKTLSSLEHIRLRTGMYIGRLGSGADPDDGIYVLLKEVIDNAVDEFIMGCGKQIDVEIDQGLVQVRDYGRGIPLGKVVECVSVINTGAKYNDDVFQFSVGLNGVGTKAVNALSAHFVVRSYRDGRCAEVLFERGELKKQKKSRAPDEPDGTYVEFLPDPDIFGEYDFNHEFVERPTVELRLPQPGPAPVFQPPKIRVQTGPARPPQKRGWQFRTLSTRLPQGPVPRICLHAHR